MFKILLKPFIFWLSLEIIKHACDFKISPSFKILKLLAFNVAPVLVISDIISAVPVNGATSVLPKLLTSWNCVTPFEYKNCLVKLGYFVATLKSFFFFFLNSSATSSKSNKVCTSIQRSGIARTRFALPNSYFFITLILFWIFISLSFSKSIPEKPTSIFPKDNC